MAGDGRVDPNAAVKHTFAVILYSLGKGSYGLIAKLFGVTPPAVLKWIRAEAATLQDPPRFRFCARDGIQRDVAFYPVKKNKKWIAKALDRATGRTVAWVLGGRDAATFKRLYDKVKHLTNCTFYTDDWEAFVNALPKDRHVIGKQHTVAIERDNSNTRHSPSDA